MLYWVDFLNAVHKLQTKLVQKSKKFLYYKVNMLMTFQREQKGQKIDVFTENTASPLPGIWVHATQLPDQRKMEQIDKAEKSFCTLKSFCFP